MFDLVFSVRIELCKVHCIRFILGIIIHAHKLIACKGYELHLLLARLAFIERVSGKLCTGKVVA